MTKSWKTKKSGKYACIWKIILGWKSDLLNFSFFATPSWSEHIGSHGMLQIIHCQISISYFCSRFRSLIYSACHFLVAQLLRPFVILLVPVLSSELIFAFGWNISWHLTDGQLTFHCCRFGAWYVHTCSPHSMSRVTAGCRRLNSRCYKLPGYFRNSRAVPCLPGAADTLNVGSTMGLSRRRIQFNELINRSLSSSRSMFHDLLTPRKLGKRELPTSLRSLQLFKDSECSSFCNSVIQSVHHSVIKGDDDAFSCPINFTKKTTPSLF